MRSVQFTREEDIPPPEPTFNVKLVVGRLVGNTWHEPGSTVRLGEVAARAAIKNGGAVGSVLSPSTLLFEGPPEPVPAPVLAPDGPENAIVRSGSFFQGSRSYGPGEKLHYRGDLVKRLALQKPEPCSATAEYVRLNCARKMAILEPIGRLGPEDEKRLARLRRDPVEASEKDRQAAKKLYELAAAL
jgi:hypothetical protein